MAIFAPAMYAMAALMRSAWTIGHSRRFAPRKLASAFGWGFAYAAGTNQGYNFSNKLLGGGYRGYTRRTKLI